MKNFLGQEKDNSFLSSALSYGVIFFFVYKEAWKYENKIAGRFLIITNNQTFSDEDILNTYKQLMEIEYCFRQLKHFEDMRPFFHKSDNGLRAHVFLSVLTLLVEKIINKKVPDMTAREVISELKKIKLSKVKQHLICQEYTTGLFNQWTKSTIQFWQVVYS